MISAKYTRILCYWIKIHAYNFLSKKKIHAHNHILCFSFFPSLASLCEESGVIASSGT